eukprot:9483051-Pyramimonas_sp.AAC.1
MLPWTRPCARGRAPSPARQRRAPRAQAGYARRGPRGAMARAGGAQVSMDEFAQRQARLLGFLERVRREYMRPGQEAAERDKRGRSEAAEESRRDKNEAQQGEVEGIDYDDSEASPSETDSGTGGKTKAEGAHIIATMRGRDLLRTDAATRKNTRKKKRTVEELEKEVADAIAHANQLNDKAERASRVARIMTEAELDISRQIRALKTKATPSSSAFAP